MSPPDANLTIILLSFLVQKRHKITNTMKTMSAAVVYCMFHKVEGWWISMLLTVRCPRALSILLPAAVLRVVHFLSIQTVRLVRVCGGVGVGSGSLPVVVFTNPFTFFQMGILAFSWLMQCWMACWPSCRCGDEIAMTTLAWPTSTHLRSQIHSLKLESRG